MSEIEKCWQDLPDWFKVEAVSYLDFKSRRQLRACSKNDKFLVDNSLFYLKKIAFFVESRKVSLYLSTLTKTITKHSFAENENSTLDLINDFLRVFQHPRTLVEELTMEFSDIEKSKMVIKEIKKAQENWKIRAKKIIWYSCPSNLHAVEFVNHLAIGTLKTIRFEYQSENLEMLRKLMETEQWKGSEEITSSTVLPIGVDILKFSNAKKLKIKLETSEFNIEKIQNLITNFKNANHPVGSYFSILERCLKKYYENLKKSWKSPNQF